MNQHRKALFALLFTLLLSATVTAQPSKEAVVFGQKIK